MLLDKSIDILDKVVCHDVSVVKSCIIFLCDALY